MASAAGNGTGGKKQPRKAAWLEYYDATTQKALRAPTAAEAAAIKAAAAADSSCKVVHVVCSPWAGGTAGKFRPWATAIDAFCRATDALSASSDSTSSSSQIRVKLWAIALPGREKRMGDKPVDDMDVVIDRVVQEMVERKITAEPFALYGHSMGANLSIELARRLAEKHGAMPVHLFIGAMRSPNAPVTKRVYTYKLPNKEFIAYLRKLGGTPAAVLDNPELMELFLPMLRADFKMVDEYKSGTHPKLSCPITCFLGRTDEIKEHRAQGWEDETTSTFDMVWLDGGHFFPITHQDELLKTIVQKLAASM